MRDIEDLCEQLDTWCASYVRAFEAFDVEAIGAHWAFPALILSGNQHLSLPDADQFNHNTSMLVGFYKAQHVALVERSVISVMPMGAASVAMQVHDKMMSIDAEPIASWTSAYVLRRVKASWRAIFADAAGEVEAWAARGTPLGSKKKS